MVRSVCGAGLAGKIKTYLVSCMLRWRCGSHIQVQLLSSLELRERSRGRLRSRSCAHTDDSENQEPGRAN